MLGQHKIHRFRLFSPHNILKATYQNQTDKVNHRKKTTSESHRMQQTEMKYI
jgi:hypothetical protein